MKTIARFPIRKRLKFWFCRLIRIVPKELQEVLDLCQQRIDEGKLTCGIPVFFPVDEDRPLYEVLVKMEVFARDPLEGGYLFLKDYMEVYRTRPNKEIPNGMIKPENVVEVRDGN